jgi:hypothetical protein
MPKPKDPLLQTVRMEVLRQAETIQALPPLAYQKTGRRLLGVSRECLRRVLCLSMAWRLTGEARFAKRADEEMLVVAGFPDWNPSHFLDVAEMTTALAIGYDWTYDQLSVDERKMIATTIAEKGLRKSFAQNGKEPGWLNGSNNWGQVCNGGMTLGALAIAETNPELAAEVVSRSVNGVPHAMKVYEPDGAYPEGPGYWEYGTSYNVLMIDALETALKTDFGLFSRPGFAETAEYYLHMTGPTGLYFNYSDCGISGEMTPAMAWFSRRTVKSELLWREVEALKSLSENNKESKRDRFFPLYLLWLPASIPGTKPTALSWHGNGETPVAVHRTAWGDKNAAFVGIKAGGAFASHAHMDAGTFVFDWGGVRWAMDLGMQDYNSLESQKVDLWNKKPGSQRWSVFRIGPFSHNIITIDGQMPDVMGRARILSHSNAPLKTTTVDLTEVYRGQLAGCTRKITLQPNGSLVVEDSIRSSAKPVRIRWAMATPAVVEIQSRTQAILKKDGRRLRFCVTGGKEIGVETYPTDPPAPYDAPNPGTRMIGFTLLVEPSSEAKVEVDLLPDL